MAKIYVSANAHGLPLDFIPTRGEVHDCKVAPEFIVQPPPADCTIADKGYDKEELREIIKQKLLNPIIPRKYNSTIGNDDMDWSLYKYRHLVEKKFARLKYFCTIAARYNKLKKNYASMVALACGFMWLPI